MGRLSPDSRRDLCVAVANVKARSRARPHCHAGLPAARCALERCDTRSRRGSRSDGRRPTSAARQRRRGAQRMPADIADSSSRSEPSSTARCRSDGEDLRVAAARLRGERDQGHEEPRLWPARTEQVTSTPDGAETGASMPVVSCSTAGPDRRQPRGDGNVADYFASLDTWASRRLSPCAGCEVAGGARDVGAAVTWLKSHAPSTAATPNGSSWSPVTGAYHAALRLQAGAVAAGTARPAGPCSCRARTLSTSRRRRRGSWSISARIRSDGLRW